MDTYLLEKDLTLFYVTANSFPDGVMDAYQRLHALLGEVSNRIFYGISYFNDQRNIVYHAAVEQSYPGEADEYGCNTFILKQGQYLSEIIPDIRVDMQGFSRIFDEMTARPDIDPLGCCVEMYISEHSARCMVRMKSDEVSA